MVADTTLKLSRDGTLVYAITLSVIAGLCLLGLLFAKSSEQVAMESLAAFVLEHGKVDAVKPEGMVQFEIPIDHLHFRYITAEPESGGNKAVHVRQRDHRHADIYFVDQLANGTAAYFFLTSLKGRLIKAAYLDPGPHQVADAEERFAREVEFWGKWQEEYAKK